MVYIIKGHSRTNISLTTTLTVSLMLLAAALTPSSPSESSTVNIVRFGSLGETMRSLMTMSFEPIKSTFRGRISRSYGS